MSEEVPKPSVEAIAQRLDSMDKAITLLQGFADRTPTTSNVHGEVLALKELTGVQIAAESRLNVELNRQRDTYEKRIADILAEQKSKDALLLSTQVDKLAITTGERLGAVEKNQYTTGGSASVRDPALVETLSKITTTLDALSKTGDKTEGRSSGIKDGFGYIVGGVGLLVGVLSVIGFVLSKG